VGGRGRSGADLPWGWWLRVRGQVLEDEQGRQWSSVRDAFWQGLLGFPPVHFAPEQHELLLRVLASHDCNWVGGVERQHDLFGGDMANWRFYMCWLASIGLTEPSSRVTAMDAPLTELGRSVLVMLQATREPGWAPLPFRAIKEAVQGAAATESDASREEALKAFEREVALLPYVFARERVHDCHVLTLTGTRGEARLPLRRVMWSQSFPDSKVRDDFFGWIAERVDRWEDWGELAYRQGAAALTQHFLQLLVATRL
jgi:hypothetical protein